jgi:hypothetical protein
MNKKLILVILALAALVLTGCSAPATNADEVLVHKGAGITEGHENKGCVEPAQRQIFWGTGAGDEFRSYPANQRVFDFRGVKGSDHAPFEVISKDGIKLTVPGTMSFLLNTDCQTLQKFHDRIGNRYHAYMAANEDGVNVTGKGWSDVLNLYMAPPLDSTLDREAKKYTWKELRTDPAIKDTINTEVGKTIKRLINDLTEGPEEFFTGFAPLILQPIAPANLVKSVEDEQTSVAAARASQAKSEADAAAAKAAAIAQISQKDAELKVAQKEAQIRAAEIRSFGGPEAYAKYQAVQKGINPWQPSYSSQLVQP